MLVVGVAIASFVAFVAAFQASGLVVRARGVIATTRAALQVMMDPSLSDDEKEQRVRSASRSLLVAFCTIALRTGLVVAAPALVLYAADVLGLAPSAAVMAFLLSWPALVGFSVMAAVAFAVLPRA
jgi:hypothetical protein